MMTATDLVMPGVMLGILLGAFAAMTWYRVSQALVMPVVACMFLALNPPSASSVVARGFAEFGSVAVLFTAIAIPAHQLQSARLFDLFGAWLGRMTGWVSLHFPKARLPILVGSMTALTTITAALMHNITSIFVMVAITIAICDRYRLPSRWLLCSELVASNLGGFSSSWGDTPNIVEARVWGLTDQAFLTEILPGNLIVLVAVSICAILLTTGDIRRSGVTGSAVQAALGVARFELWIDEIVLDKRRLWIGLFVLIAFIVLQFFWRQYEMTWAALAIMFAVTAERPDDRLPTLQSLGLDVYMTLLSVFIIAHSIGASRLGGMLYDLIKTTHGAPWAIVISSYVGTMFTEAASWASTAAPVTHAINPSHAAAWALGGGICAGSSSLLTAASAGIILWTESGRRRGHEVTFGSYFGFGLLFSLAMMAFYIAYTALVSF